MKSSGCLTGIRQKTNNTVDRKNNPYGHLLDKYLVPAQPDRMTKQRGAEEEKRYGNLLDHAKPDNSALELMAKMEEERMERRKQEAKEKELEVWHRRARVEEERRKEEEHNAKVRSYAESLIERKQEQIKADADRKEQARKEAEQQREIYGRIDSLMKIGPEPADAYIQALKKAGAI